MIYIDLESKNLYFRWRKAGTKKIHRDVYKIAIGRYPRLTPRGRFHIVRKIIHGDRYLENLKPAEVEELSTPTIILNILCENRPIAIHGCKRGAPLSKQFSGGCIKMLEDDLIKLFNHVEKGMPVVVWDEPYDTIMRDGFDNIPNYNRYKNYDRGLDINGNLV